MAQDKLYGGFSQLPTWAKGVVAVVGVSFFAVTSYIIYKSIKDALNNDNSPEQAKDDLKQLKKQGITQSVSDTQITAWAEEIWNATADLGTDEETIYNVFKQLKNEADLYRLIEIYGVRDQGAFFYNPERTLVQQIVDDLSASELAKLNNILATKRIKFRF